MNDLIRLLPDHVANQIAAGEVVQRPASVVKELLENSVDAGARRIHLVVKDAGRTLVQVSDDGRGMSANDARLCFERHATSKIRAADDLMAVRTKGFRGEALASIAAVAQVELRTRLHEEEFGTRVAIEGSRLRAQEPATGPAGTTLSVRNLFFNIPARRQFLKSDPVEMRHVIDEFQRVALAHPDVAFTLTHNDEEIFHLDAAGEGTVPGAALRQRIVGIFGRRYDERLVPVEESTEFVTVTGFVGKPEFARRSRGEQFFFVNRRYVRSNYLDHAVRGAYEELITRESYPGWTLFIDLDPAQIDINIHPTKTEIKFRDDRAVYAIVHAAVRRALGRFNIAPSLDFDPEPAIAAAMATGGTPVGPWRPQDIPRRSAEGWQQLLDVDRPAATPSIAPLVPEEAERIVPSREHDGPPGSRPVFQMHGAYIIAQLRSGFVVIDQQRAHERIQYERALHCLENGSGASQAQLFPRNVELNAADHALLQELLPGLRALGFDLAPLGGRTVVINGMPAEAADDDAAKLLETMIEQVKNEREALRNERHAVLARGLARSMAPRGGRHMDAAQMHELIDRLFACAMPYFTPGGKPTLITFGLEELNERFGR